MKTSELIPKLREVLRTQDYFGHVGNACDIYRLITKNFYLYNIPPNECYIDKIKRVELFE